MSSIYGCFRTWDEMYYLQQKVLHTAISMSNEEMKAYCTDFPSRVKELKETDNQFAEDFANYERALQQKCLILNPQTDQEKTINEMILKMKKIDFSFRPIEDNINDPKKLQKQATTKHFYENRLRKYLREESANATSEIISLTKNPRRTI